MPLGTDPLSALVVPDGTTAEERDLVTESDVIVGGQSTVEFGIRGRNVLAGERVRFGGDIEADGDCRLDMWCSVDGNVLVGRNAYLGDRVHVAKQLLVSGDLDIGDDARIEEGFEASGWIHVRSPVPMVVFLVIYLVQLLRLGEEAAAERLLSEVLDEDADDTEADPLIVPRGSRVSDDSWRVSTPARIGDGCRLHGNLQAAEIEFGRDGVLFGSLRARRDIVVGRGAEIKGDVTTRGGDVRVGPGATIWGEVSAENIALNENATIDGAIRARGETRLHTDDVIDRPVESGRAIAAEADAPPTPVERGDEAIADDGAEAGRAPADDGAGGADGGPGEPVDASD